MKQFAARQAANMKRMAKIGDIVRTVVQWSANAENLFHTQITTTTDRISNAVAIVPDSLFVVPAGYTRTTPTLPGSLHTVPSGP